MSRAYVPDAGDIVWLNFDPQTGHEQAGHRPALVLSPAAYNAKTRLMVCCPMTTQIKNYPFEVAIAGPSPSAVLADQIDAFYGPNDCVLHSGWTHDAAQFGFVLEVSHGVMAACDLRDVGQGCCETRRQFAEHGRRGRHCAAQFVQELEEIILPGQHEADQPVEEHGGASWCGGRLFRDRISPQRFALVKGL